MKVQKWGTIKSHSTVDILFPGPHLNKAQMLVPGRLPFCPWCTCIHIFMLSQKHKVQCEHALGPLPWVFHPYEEGTNNSDPHSTSAQANRQLSIKDLYISGWWLQYSMTSLTSLATSTFHGGSAGRTEPLSLGSMCQAYTAVVEPLDGTLTQTNK